jgi:hypothetical protein
MTEMVSYAASLTNAVGNLLEPEIIVAKEQSTARIRSKPFIESIFPNVLKDLSRSLSPSLDSTSRHAAISKEAISPLTVASDNELELLCLC